MSWGNLIRTRKNNLESFLKRRILGRVVVLSLKIVINLPMTSESFAVKENHISVAVSEILLYRQTDLQTLRHPVSFI